MGDDVTVRNLVAADHDAWLPLWRGYQQFYKEEIPAETTRVTWARILDPSEPVFGAIALAGDRAVGMVHWLFHRSCWTVGSYCYLQDLFVVPDHRGSGIGRKLIEHVFAAARDAGCAKVYWLTQETNANAMLLYDRIARRSGFVQYEKLLT
ncbi:MAG: GNAT family N-acetyltransferase [Candidatus Acidiferrales bacterium]